MTDPLADFHEGDMVQVSGHLQGTLRFKGPVSFAPGFWAGVELTTAEGDTDGQREGKRYFSCHPDYGVLVPGSEICALEEGAVTTGGLKKAVELVVSPNFSISDEASSDDEEQGFVVKDTDHRESERVNTSEIKTSSHKASSDDAAEDSTKPLSRNSGQTQTSVMSGHPHPARKSGIPTRKAVQDKTSTPTIGELQNHQEDQKDSQHGKESRVEKTTSAMANGLLNNAISKVMQIRRSRHDTLDSTDSTLINGSSDYDSGVDPSHDSSMDHTVGISPEPEFNGGEGDDRKHPLSPEMNVRCRSPAPSEAAVKAEVRNAFDLYCEQFGIPPLMCLSISLPFNLGSLQ